MIGNNATEGEWGATAFTTRAVTQDYALTSYGAALAWNERVELSVARQDFDAGAAVASTALRRLACCPASTSAWTCSASSCVWRATPCSTPTPGCPRLPWAWSTSGCGWARCVGV